MKSIVYRITIFEPGLFTALEGDPNSGVSFPFIPGSVLRGALIHKYRGAANALDPATDTARQLFFNGRTRFLNAYPVKHNARSEPTPKTWHHVKRQDDEARDAIIQELDPKKQWNDYAAPFVIHADAVQETIQPERQLTIHIQRPREHGRPTRGNGAIFRYEALAAQQVFEAEIQCEDSDENTLKGLLDGEISLGGSRTGAYGRAQIEISQNDDQEKKQEQNESKPKENTDKLRVIFMSDVLLRDECGQYTSDPKIVRRAIAKRLGVDESALCEPDDAGKPNLSGEPNAFMRTRHVGGFNRTWGLPLPQMLGIEMGSVFEFEMPQGKPDFEALETQGIGERRAEGFGRVARFQPVENLKTQKWDPNKPAGAENSAAAQQAETAKPVTLDGDSSAVATKMVERLVRRRLDENVVATAYALDMDADKLKPIRPAQLSRLRNLIHDVLMSPPAENADENKKPKTPRERVQNYMADVMTRSTPKKQFTRARVDGKRLADWIQNILELNEQDSRLQEVFGLEGVTSLGQHTPTLTPELKGEYALKFLDAALRRALNVKRDKEG